ncbi:MAG: PKD domain-containing protein, partial [Candidatus Promineifilaceae bacterium]
LASVDTSHWAAGLYTITVNLVDGGGDPITDGSGYGYLAVGQALGVSQSVEPTIVAPGTVTVTTVLATEILVGGIISPSAQLVQPIEPRLWQTIEDTAEQETAVPEASVEETAEMVENDPLVISTLRPHESPVTLTAPQILTTTGVTRTEQNDGGIVYSGTWTNLSMGRASGGNYYRADDPGDTAAFTFTGALVSLGMIGSSSSANVEVFIDGISQGVLDLYRREDTPLTFTYDNFITGTHTISVTHIGVSNPFSFNDFVQLDYVDVWDGTTMPDGIFEQDSDRVFAANWSNINNGTASGGTYYADGDATAWFPFSGDSVTLQSIAYNNGGAADIYIDGKWRTRLNLYNISTVTRTLSFNNLGSGFHTMMVTTYQGNATVDTFTTPGTGPFYTPPTPSGFTRFEDDDPAMVYNGVPYTVTARSWTRGFSIIYSEASGSQYIYSNTADDTVSLTFDGVWTAVGLATGASAGMAEIYLDGVSQEVVDLYTNEDGVTSFTFDNLVSGSHTISVTVLHTANPLSSNSYVYVDYIDVWDGASLPSGTFEQDDARVLRGGGWTDYADAGASGGSYIEENYDGTIWFPFEGDSVTYQALDYFRSQKVAIYIDEEFQDYYEIYTGQAPTITYSFDGLGAGLHVMKIRHYRSRATVDAFITPAVAPSPPPPTPTTFTRYEEDYPAIQYNGLPYIVTAASWNRTYNNFRASDGQYINTAIPGNTISLDFTGTWIGLGFVTNSASGQVEVFIDGNSQGVIDLYTRDDDVAEFEYGGLSNGSHTLSLTLLATKHPNSSGTNLYFDYYESWDGTNMPAATYEETSSEVRLGDYFMNWDYFNEPAASGGTYINNGFQHPSAAWFPFTGDSVTYLALADSSGDRVRLSVDGDLLGTFNIYNNVPITRAYSFDGFGPGPHIMQVRYSRGESNIDAFIVPALAPIYETPVYTGVVRYEEDNPALLYNNTYDFVHRPQSWSLNTISSQVSGLWHVTSSGIGDSVSLTFDGRWAAAGFRTRNQTGEAEIFIDGVSQGTYDLSSSIEDTTVIPFGGLITGTHTISVSVATGTVFLDYLDVWDGQPMSDDIINLRRSEDNPRLHYSASLVDVEHPNGIEGDYMGLTLFNAGANIWYTFVGDSFTFLGFSRNNTTNVDLYVDGVFIENIDVQYPYSEQPLAFHYNGFSEEPHIVRIHNGSSLRADAFQSNPAVAAPYSPTVEWYDTTPGGGSGAFGTPAGMLMGIAAGDVDGDGLVEIVAPSDTYTTGGFINSIFIYRGDGLDTGDGDPLIRRIDFDSTGIALGRETIGSVALADLDGQPGAEIIIGTEEGMYAFKGDGSTLWFTDTYKALIINATPAVGNLDFDDSPEIVVNMDKNLVVYEANGDIAWSTAFTSTLGTPVLADMNNDGRLDIIVYDGSGKVYLYDYNFGSPILEWQTQLSSPVVTVRGGPAIADLDGDGFPEIAMTHDGAHTVLDKDGNVVWSIPLDPGAAGGVSIADIDGDLEPEIVTGIKYDDGTGIGRLYALNADGSILWAVPAYDDTSANSQSVLDINGDGVYEIAWNGAQTGFTIFNGADGSILFNEPLANSLTGTEYPIFADVDQDGYAEVVIPTNHALVVLGQDGIWGESRPIWNEHTYHITNINDDMSVPFSEANSWDIHNTYRTQWPEAVVLPIYDVTLTHTVGITGVSVVSSSFSVSPTVSADPLYGWDYTQSWADTAITRTFESVLTDLQPGETRLVAQGTEVAYDLPSGTNYLTLPPMYISVPHIINVVPLSLTTGVGGTAVFDVILDNPAAASETYTLTVAGLPSEWVTLPETVVVGAGSQVTVTLTVQTPGEASPGSLPFNVFAVNSSGGQDQSGAELNLIDGLDVTIEPDSQIAPAGTAVTYTLVVTNNLTTAQTYTLTAEGAANVTLPPTVFVSGSSSASLPVTVSADADGYFPFTVSAENGSAAESDSAVLIATGSRAVDLTLSPALAVGGPETPAVFTVTVSNLGDVSDIYDLAASVPAGWSYEFRDNGGAIDSLSLTPAIFHTADILLFVTPPAGETPGNYSVDVTAQSQSSLGVSDTASGTVQVQTRGVDISIDPVNTTMLPTDTGQWQVTITNTGSVADSFWLTTTGFIGPFSAFAANPVALNAGQSTTVQLTADGLDFALPNTYQFGVVAESQNNALIKNEVIANITFENFEAVEVGWIPASQTITDTLSTTFLMVITNTGNLATTFDFGLNLPPGLTGQFGTTQLPLPAHVAAGVLVTVQADGPGVYMIEGTADSATSAATDSSTATLEVVFTTLPPSADAGNDQTADEGQTVSFNGTASDPEGQPLDILWDFGDGATATGTLTPTHAYDDDGQFAVTLTVTDDTGLSDSDTLTVTVSNVAPTVNAGSNQMADEGDTVSLDPATFTDPGSADTHTATIDWGDGTVEAGTVNQANNTVSGSHVYDDNGSYTVTVTVTDDDSGSDSDTFTVTVNNVAPSVDAGADQNVAVGDMVSLDPATFTDPGSADTHTAIIDWDDGTVEPGTVNQANDTVSGSHVYTQAGTYTVTVTVLDDDGDQSSDTFTVVVTGPDTYYLYMSAVFKPE